MRAAYRTLDGDEGGITAPLIIAYPHEDGFALLAVNQNMIPVAGIFDLMEFEIDES